MSPDAPSRNEDEYFAKQNAELIAAARAKEIEAAAVAERRTHFMKCPKCGHDLLTQEIEGVQIDACPFDGGIWLDQGELDALRGHQNPGIFSKILTSVTAALHTRKS